MDEEKKKIVRKTMKELVEKEKQVPRPRQKRDYRRNLVISEYIMRRWYNPETPFGRVFSHARSMVDREIYEEQVRRQEAGLPLYDG